MTDAELGRAAAENRRKIVLLDQNEIMAILNWREAPVGSYLHLEQPKIPRDAVVEQVTFEWQRRAWAIVLVHTSFDRTIEGAYLPVLEGPVAHIEKRSLL